MSADEHLSEGERRAVAAVAATGVPYRVVRHGPVRSAAEAAAARGVAVDALAKTMVVRRADDDFVLVLVPGPRQIAWPRLRDLLGVSRLSMPDATTAYEATGFERGTITPFGATRSWPVVVDERLLGREVAVGAGAHGVGIVLDGDDLVRALGAQVADVSEPAAAGSPDRPDR